MQRHTSLISFPKHLGDSPIMKTKKGTDPSIKILLDITHYGVNLISGRSSIASNHKMDKSMAHVSLEGASKPPGWTFHVYAYPDGTPLYPAFVREAEGKIEMCINHSQLAPLLTLLQSAAGAHALYRVDNGEVYADVHGEWDRPKLTAQEVKKATTPRKSKKSSKA